jgi:hypothetical protein
LLIGGKGSGTFSWCSGCCLLPCSCRVKIIVRRWWKTLELFEQRNIQINTLFYHWAIPVQQPKTYV